MGLQLLIYVLPIGPVILDLEVKKDGWRQCYHTAEDRDKMKGRQQLGVHKEETPEDCGSQKSWCFEEGVGVSGKGRTLMPTLSKAHFSCVYSANLLMKESSFSGMITLLRGTGSADVGAGPPFHL